MIRLNLSLTSKIVCLVALMGLISALVTAYATSHTLRLDRAYQALMAQQSKTSQLLDRISQSLAQTNILVHSVLLAQDEQSMLNTRSALLQLQMQLEQDLADTYALLPGNELLLDSLFAQSRHAFDQGQLIVNATLHWRGDRALRILKNNFTPAETQLRSDVYAARRSAEMLHEQSAQAVKGHMRRSIATTTISGWLTLLLTSALAAWVAFRYISRPISRLTDAMRELHAQNYHISIGDQDRRDELGSMARTLEDFKQSLQQAHALEQELQTHQRSMLLTEQLQELTSALPGAVFQLSRSPDGQLQLRFVSSQWAMLMGLPESYDDNASAATSAIRTHAGEARRISEQHYHRSAETLELIDFVVPVEMPDGSTRWIQTRATPRREDDGSTTFHGVWLDVSKEIQQARALEKSKRQAEQVAKEKTALQASISHEIRTPLNAILGLTQLLLKSDPAPAQREQLQSVLRTSKHLRGIVNEVLDFSKIDAGQMQLESTDFSLREVLEDVMMMTQEDAQAKGLQLSCQTDPVIPDALRGDPHRVAQILLNYVNNAIKFTHEGRIDIHIQLAPESTLHRIMLHVSVRDTGIGIPADRLEQLFEPFQQADSSITRRFGGSGLGLTISRALAHLMGGQAGVYSQLGQGSTFWFTAALEPARSLPKPVARPAKSDHHTPAHWKGMRALVVDDNPINRTVAQGLLHAAGFEVMCAHDGAHALQVLQSHASDYFDCVFMDLQMPNMDGLTAARTLRQEERFHQLPIIAMTAHTGVQDRQQTREAGMNAHLCKPLLENNLHEVLMQCLPDPNFSLESAPADPASPESTSTTETDPPLPPLFDASAIDALASVFEGERLQSLLQQFMQDTQERCQQLPAMAQAQDWAGMRSHAHKLSGTAATFGQMQLGHWSAALSAAAKAEDAQQVQALSQQLVHCCEQGLELLRQYRPVRSQPQI